MKLLPHTFVLLLLVLTDAKRQPPQVKHHKVRPPPSTPIPPHTRSVPASGDLSTADGHRCVWQTSGEVLVNLLVNCSSAETPRGGGGGGGPGSRYWCRYAGKPDLCSVTGLKSSQYWKQLVAKLKRRRNACEGAKVLKVRTCKKVHAEVHMKLVQRGGGGGGGRRGEEKKPSEQEKPERKKKEAGFQEEGVMKDMQVEESYCSDGWRSICSFLLKVFEGN